MADHWKIRNKGRVMPSRFAPPSQTVELASLVAPALAPSVKAARLTRRHDDLMQAMRQIDAAPTPEMLREISDWIRDAYEARGGGTLVGLFGHCYLGHPYVDHSLGTGAGDHGGILGHGIIEHFQPSDAVPSIYRGARSLAASESYAMIEIYSDGQIVPIRHDGTPAV